MSETGGTKRKRQEKAPERPMWGGHRRPQDGADKEVLRARCAAERHVTAPEGREREKEEVELKKMEARLRLFFQDQNENIARLERRLSQIQNEAKQAEDLCESTIVLAIDSLQEHYLSVKKSIEARRKAAAAPVREQLQSLRLKLDSIRELEYLLHCQAPIGSSAHRPKDCSSLLQLCEEDLQQALPEGPVGAPLSFQLTKQAFGNLGVKLENFYRKEFSLIFEIAKSEGLRQPAGSTVGRNLNPENEATTSQPLVRNLSGVGEFILMRPGISSGSLTFPPPVAELPLLTATRQQYLQYACNISLDPHTAHPDLHVFPTEKKVELCTHKSKPKVARCPERFAQRRQVLCCEPLPARPCYFEVNAQGGKSQIALTYASISRKSQTAASAFGATKKSWSLDCSTHYSVSHNGDSVQLTSPPSCPTIGVFVNFKTGTLRFYEVTDTMKFLYQVSAEFTEPLYPGFWLGEKCCITICHLTH